MARLFFTVVVRKSLIGGTLKQRYMLRDEVKTNRMLQKKKKKKKKKELISYAINTGKLAEKTGCAIERKHI